MRNKIISLLIAMSLILLSAVPARGAVITSEVPDFEAYAESAGYDLLNYPYYVVYTYERDGYLNYAAYFTTENITITENADTSGGSWSTSVYMGYLTLTDFVEVTVYYDSSGDYVKNRVRTDEIMGNATTYMYVYNTASFLYSNHDILMNHTNSDVSTFFIVAPYSKGQRTTIGTAISHQTIQQPLKKQIISLLPLLILFLIWAIGLRKGLQMLLIRLQQA